MIEFLRQLVTGVFEAWKRLSISARVQIGLAAALTVVILGGVILLGGQPQYVELFTRLSPSEADTVIVWLTERDIKYQLRDGGRTIRVPAQQQSTARVGLVSQGIPRTQGTIPGFEIFDTQTLMTNKWLQDTNYMRAVKGELTRTLNGFDFVRNSSVFISEAQNQLFRSEQKPSQASVFLDLYRPITDGEIAAVLHTVSAFGGHKLNERNITIANTQGQVLKRPDSDDMIALASDRREVREAWETHYQNKVYRALDRMGYNAIVTASVLVDWDTVEKHEREVKEGQIISLLDSGTTVTTEESPPEGVAGATANIIDGGVFAGGTRTTEEVTETIENTDPSETVTTTLTPPGRLKKLSLGVLVDDISVETTDDQGETTTTRQAPTAQDLTTLEALVLSAVSGAALETEVSVAHHSFPQEGVALAGIAALPGSTPWLQNRIILTVLQGFLILAAFFAIRFFMRRALVLPSAEEEEVVEIPEATKEDMRRMEIAAEVERLSREEPESVAALLRSWMAEER